MMAAYCLLVSSLVVVGMMILFFFRYGVEKADKILASLAYLLLLIVPGVLSYAGFLQDFSDFPSPLQKLLMTLFVLTLIGIVSPWARRVSDRAPYPVLVGLQAFRFLPEAFLWLAYREGLAPIQMTLHGRNLDILTAILSLIFLFAWRFLRNPRPFVLFHTAFGLLLLLNVVGTAILSMPSPFRIFLEEPSTAFVGTFPYVWLPSVHVVTALLLHGLTLRKLLSTPRDLKGEKV